MRPKQVQTKGPAVSITRVSREAKLPGGKAIVMRVPVELRTQPGDEQADSSRGAWRHLFHENGKEAMLTVWAPQGADNADQWNRMSRSTTGCDTASASSAPDPLSAPPAIEARELYRFYHVGDDETQALRGVSIHVNAGGSCSSSVRPAAGNPLSWLASPDSTSPTAVSFGRINGQRLTRRDEKTRANLRAQARSESCFRAEICSIISRFGRTSDSRCTSPGRSTTPGLVKCSISLESASAVTRIPRTSLGGEASRAGLAVALAPASPPSSLPTSPRVKSSKTEQKILTLFEQHRTHGGAILIVTHSDAIASRADRIIRIEDGRIVK